MNIKKTGLLLILISLFAAALITACGGKNKEAVLKEPAPPPVDTFEQLNAKIDELTNQIIKNMTERKKNTIAVIEFTDLNGKVTDFGRFLSEKLITKLFLTRSFNVIERSQLNKVMSEHKLNLSGTVDPASAKKLGKILGVNAIATGTITDMGQNLDVNARLIDTETANIFAVASVTINKDSAVLRLMGGEDSSSSKAQKEAKEITFENMKFVNRYLKIQLISGKIEKDGKIVLNFTQTNFDNSIQDKNMVFILEEDETYLVDERGKRYGLHSYNSYRYDGRIKAPILKLPQNVPYSVTLAFSGGKNDASAFSLVLKLRHISAGLIDTPWRDVAEKESSIVINGIRLR